MMISKCLEGQDVQFLAFFLEGGGGGGGVSAFVCASLLYISP